ncbi:MAG TPA: hypothetical protein VFJ76_06675 [Solirubrobacterales bacterium]|nr:hypothetical protein [Solirubrobacterales bacterium]
MHYFEHDPHATVLDGPVSAAAGGVRVSVEGKPLRQGVMLARVDGSIGRAIHAEEPFGFFAVYVPRCVEPSDIRIQLLGPGDSKLGVADEWDVSVEHCRGSA